MENLHDQIAQKAYELFQARGGQDGYHIADWLQAEKEIVGTSAAKKAAPKKTPAPKKVATKAAAPKAPQKKAAAKK